MESSFKSQLTEQGYIHEILAEFGTEEAGVFPKDKVDEAIKIECYTYNDLSYIQNMRVRDENLKVVNISYKNSIPPYNPFRTVGVINIFIKNEVFYLIFIIQIDIKLTFSR